MSLYRPLALAGVLALVGGCVTIPQPLQGTYTNISSASAQQGGAGGELVRWGGEIIKTEPGAQETCFYLLSRPLDAQARPKTGTSGESEGRFVACRTGFYDPEVFVRGRELRAAISHPNRPFVAISIGPLLSGTGQTMNILAASA